MLRRRASQPATTPRRTVVVCALGAARFAVPADRVVELAPVAAYTPVPCEDPANLGMALHRDRLVPLVDLHPRLGLGRAGPAGPPGLCLFVRSDAGEVCFPIDGVVGLAPATDEGPGLPVLNLGAWGGFHG